MPLKFSGENPLTSSSFHCCRKSWRSCARRRISPVPALAVTRGSLPVSVPSHGRLPFSDKDTISHIELRSVLLQYDSLST